MTIRTMGITKEPKTKGKTGPMSKLTKEKKLKQFANIVESGSYSDYTDIEIARDLKITRQTLYSFKKQLGSIIKNPDLEVIKIDLLANYNRLRRRLAEISSKVEDLADTELNNGDLKPEYIYVELRVLKEIRETIKEYVKILEDFGIKEKVADKVDSRVLILNADIDMSEESNNILKELIQ
jgi:predicted DNA-binding protein YlxM (UPF0122 family)